MRGDEDVFVDESLYLAEVANLKGVSVFSSSGKKLGKLESVVISRHSGNITYVVLSCTRLLGLRRERYVLPPSALSRHSGNGGFVVDLDGQNSEGRTSAKPIPPVFARLDPARAE